MKNFWQRDLLMDPDPAAGGGGNPPAFDPTAFQTSLMDQVNRTLNGALKGLKTDLTKALEALRPANPNPNPDPNPNPNPDPNPNPNPNPDPGNKVDPAVAAQLRAMERRLKDSDDRFNAMKAESDATKAAAEKKELDATVRTKLNKYKFADEAAAEDAFEIFGAKIKRDDSGNFVGHDGTPIDQYLEEGIRGKPYLLAPKDASGAGARSGKAGSGSKAYTLDDIKPGMKPEEYAAISAQILAAQRGQ